MSEPVTINLRFMARDLNLPPEQVHNVVELLDEGHPVPFIARYRKDRTGNLDEEQIRRVQAELASLRTLAERKQTILRSIESLGQLTPELDKKIREAKSAKRLEDIYLPFKPKKKTLASEAREKGLEPFAMNILEADDLAADLDKRALAFVDPDKKVLSAAEALLGAGHIIGELFVEKIELRHEVREIIHRSSKLATVRVAKEPAREAETKNSKNTGNIAGNSLGNAGEIQPETDKPETDKTETDKPIESTGAAEPADRETSLEPAGDHGAEPVAAESQSGELPDKTEPGNTETAEVNATDDVREETGEAVSDSGSGGGEADVDGRVDGPVVSERPVPDSAPESASAVDEEKEKETDANDARPNDARPADEESHGLMKEDGGGVAEEPPGTLEAREADETGEAGGKTPSETEEIDQKFREWKEQQKEKGIPVVRSQNQIKKKKAKEKKKQREEAKLKRQEGLDRHYHDYFDFTSDIRRLPPHRIMAINRGEKIKAIRVRIQNDMETLNRAAESLCVAAEHPHAVFLAGVARDALARLLVPSIERELRNDLTEQAENQSIRVFAKNLRNLLLQPPLHRKRVLAIDPGFKHGCKIVALDEFGNVLEHTTVYLTGGAEKKEKAKQVLTELVEKYRIPAIAIGNGTACRETESFVSGLLASEPLAGQDVSYVIVNESGASVYSVSPQAKEEFPEFDPLVRGTISIGRRLQDPLNELVKIDPASLGVGMYQHDIKTKPLKDALNEVVESCVNFVGVDLNTATPAILRYVAGLNQLTARRIYDYRQTNGPFKSRQELLNVPGFGQAAFTHAAGFLKIIDGENPLDATWIHPESYELAATILAKLGFQPDDLRQPEKVREIAEKRLATNVVALAEELGAGVHTVRDVLTQLAKPGRDPRESLPPPIFKKGVLKLDDLVVGMELTGTILNVVDFGAFVDIGLHDSGLIHISHLADRYIRDAHEVVSVGDIVRVWVLEVDKERHRISLTLFPPEATRRRPEHGTKSERRDHREETSGARTSRDSREQQPREQRAPRSQAPTSREGQRHEESSRRNGPGRGRDRDRNRDRGPQQPKVYEFKAKGKEVKPISEAMKTGKEPLRGFGDLAQLFGRVPAPPQEPKPNGKEKKAAPEPPESTP